MKLEEAVKRACEEPTLVKALSWIAVWESERAIKQAKSGKWDTCFEHCFQQVLDNYPTLGTAPNIMHQVIGGNPNAGAGDYYR